MNGIAQRGVPAVPPACGWRRLVRGVGRRAAHWVGGGLGGLLGGWAGGFGVLMYHRIARPGRGPAPTWCVSPARFRAQLRGLHRRGYRALPLRQLLTRSAAGRPIPPRTFAVTFDDGYENVYAHAWPVLRDLGAPATVFLATAYLDSPGPFPFDDWPDAGSPAAPAESWRPLTTAQCAEMYAGGLVDLGCHTHTHANFRGRPDAFRRDVTQSVAVLRLRFGLGAPTFAFPFGIVDADLVEAARRAGVVCGLTAQADVVRPGADPFAWGRFHADESDDAATLAAKLDGWYSLARRAWLRWRAVGLPLHGSGIEVKQ